MQDDPLINLGIGALVLLFLSAMAQALTKGEIAFGILWLVFAIILSLQFSSKEEPIT